MILDSDNIVQKTVLELPITFSRLIDLGFRIYSIDLETGTVYITYKDTHINFHAKNYAKNYLMNRLSGTFDTAIELIPIKQTHGDSLQFTSIDQLMNYINDTGYGQ